VALTGARVTLEDGTLEEREVEIQQLQGIVARAAQAGLQGVWLEARLALAELSRARAELEVIEREATGRGYLSLARRAGAAARH
jgi:hypothetical protein